MKSGTSMHIDTYNKQFNWSMLEYEYHIPRMNTSGDTESTFYLVSGDTASLNPILQRHNASLMEIVVLNPVLNSLCTCVVSEHVCYILGHQMVHTWEQMGYLSNSMVRWDLIQSLYFYHWWVKLWNDHTPIPYQVLTKIKLLLYFK